MISIFCFLFAIILSLGSLTTGFYIAIGGKTHENFFQFVIDWKTPLILEALAILFCVVGNLTVK